MKGDRKQCQFTKKEIKHGKYVGEKQGVTAVCG
jgi:hypothetical protein